MSIIENLEIKHTEYVDNVIYNDQNSTIEIIFNREPEEWKCSHIMIFEGVENFNKEIIDSEDQVGQNSFTDLVLDFSEDGGNYYMHLTCTTFSFKSKVKPICKFL